MSDSRIKSGGWLICLLIYTIFAEDKLYLGITFKQA